jgi:uncharacterized protein (DUF2384 family)
MPRTKGKEIDSLKDDIVYGDVFGELVKNHRLLQDVSTRRIEEQTRDLLGQWLKAHAPLVQIREIEALAAAVIGDRQLAFRWLSEPNPATDGKAPIDLLGDESGFDRVKTLLLRIEYGVLA